MSTRKLLRVFLIIFLFITVQSCTGTEDKEEKATFKQLPELQEIEPEKPVKIKLKRNNDGEYSWDISGGDAEEVIKIDKRLREDLKIK